MAKTDTPKGMPKWETNRQIRRRKGESSINSTPGITKGDNCHATGLEKAMAKYPRSYKNNNRALWAKWDERCARYHGKKS
jgi:hypothetical protein